jgi:glycosyltransferase involved in cell wall biosynthesis
MKKLYIVIPCYNEEEVLYETTKRLAEKMNSLISKKVISKDSKVMYVNDGSKDKTWEMIKEISAKNKLFVGLCLSRNRGHQNALLAGLMTAKNYADIVISMDADLQDDINAVDRFIEEYEKGNDVVYGVRSKREKDTFFKKFTAETFYKLMKKMGVDIVFNHADYRLMSKRALDALEQFEEVNLFLRGIVPLIGYKSSTVMYERNERFAGESKYPLKKMLAFAFDGITSFSVKPIRMIFTLGVIMFIVSLMIMAYSLIRYFGGNTVSGWTFIIISIWMIAGVQMLSLGIVGEYVGKIYNETKKRPRFIIAEELK